MVEYKLTYFDLRGIAEAIRLLFHYLEIPFEDIRINPKNWEAFKPRTPQGKLPFLEVDGRILPQSYAILRYIARKHGLAGKDEWEQAQVDELADFIQDVQYEEFAPYMYVMQGYEEGNKVQLRRDSFMPAVNRIFPILVEYLQRSKSSYFMPSGITWVDFGISQYLDKVRRYDEACFGEYPELITHMDRIHNLPQLQDYLEERQDTLYHNGETR